MSIVTGEIMRIQSDKPMRNGGWLHKINDSTPRPAPPLRRTVARPVNIDWNYRERQYTPPDGKVKAEWYGRISGLEFTIYDYKSSLEPERNTDWHIGGRNQLAAVLLGAYFKKAITDTAKGDAQ